MVFKVISKRLNGESKQHITVDVCCSIGAEKGFFFYLTLYKVEYNTSY